MMSMYGDMWMNSLNPMDMDQEMLAAYRFGRPNWNMNRYICTTCGRTYSLQASLYNHKKFECGKTPNFICPYCPHRTKQKGNLKTHIKKRHPEYFTEPFMPSPSRLNSMMNSIMMQNSMMQQSMMQNPQNTPTTQSSSSSMPNTSSPAAQLSRTYSQNPPSGAAMQNSSKTQNPSINNLLQAMKQQGVPQNSSNQNAISTASLVQALSQSLPNSTSISALDIMQVLAQGTPKSPMTPHRMSPMNASPASCNPAQSPMSANKMSPINPSSGNSNPPQSPLSANVAASMNGGVKLETPKSPTEMPSVKLEAPKSPVTPNFTTSLSLDPTESEDSSDTQILPSYPVTQ